VAVSLLKTGAECTLNLSGVVDVSEARALHAAAREAVGATGPVVVRLERLEALDTAGTQVLLALRRSLEAEGRALRFEGVPSRIADAWRQAGLYEGLA
jgi:anti-anti-sigma factor